MRNLIKKLLPKNIIEFIKKAKRIFVINKLYAFDKNRLIKYAYSVNNPYSEENLRAKITFHYHAIEKGLSNPSIRPGFGERAFKGLFFAMDKYVEGNYPTNDNRFQSALSVIESYIELHRAKDFPVTMIEDKMKKYFQFLIPENSELGGYSTIRFNDLPDFNKLSFKDLSKCRYSVRDFGEKRIEDVKVFEAIDMATKTPSVCNRQSWKVRYIKSFEKVKTVLEIQKGLTGNGENLHDLIVITADKQYMNGGHERNQTYIDGGLFTMSLLYALTSLGIASCTLNASFSLEKEVKMRAAIDVKESEDFIAIIGIGTYPDTFKIAKSPRDNYSIFTTIIG